MTEATPLPARPSLEYLKKLAKQQVAALRKQGRSASLAAAQLALARKYGFASWRKLKAHVEELERQRRLNANAEDATSENAAAGDQATEDATDENAAAKDEATSDVFGEVMKAITTRDAQSLMGLLATAPGVVNQTGPHPRWGGRPQPLHVAIESDNAEAFALLVNAGADVDGDNGQYDGWSPLMIAVHWKREEMREELIRRGAKIDLIAALMLEDDRRVARLLKDPGALAGPFPNGATPLHFARTAKAARLLLAAGLKIDRKDKYGKTAPQRWADAQRPSPGLLRLAESFGLRPPLDIFKAVQEGRLAQVRKMLAGGADVNARYSDKAQGTLLHEAAWNGNLAMAKLLVARGADVRARDREYDNTPAGFARYALGAFRRKECEAVAEYLEGLMGG